MTTLDDAGLKARELALRERQIKLEEEKFASSRRSSMLDWVRSLALPIASLIASLFFFLVQQQQQAFERTLTNVQDGLKFYYARLLEVRGVDPADPNAVSAGLALDTPEQVNAAADALKSTIKIYPEVFCSARSDLLERISASSMTAERQEQARNTILAIEQQSTKAGLATPRWSQLLSWLEPRMPPCEIASGPKPDPKADQPPIADQPVAGSAAPPAAPPIVAAAPPAPGLERSAQAPRARTEIAPAPAAPSEALASASRLYRVFAQVGPDTPRDVVDPLRAEASDAGFGIQRKVEQVRFRVVRAEVRYNGQQADGAQVAADARKLAAWMEMKLGRTVAVKDIGTIFPNMPPTNLELWIPGPDAPAASSVRSPRPRTENAAPSRSVTPAP